MSKYDSTMAVGHNAVLTGELSIDLNAALAEQQALLDNIDYDNVTIHVAPPDPEPDYEQATIIAPVGPAAAEVIGRSCMVATGEHFLAQPASIQATALQPSAPMAPAPQPAPQRAPQASPVEHELPPPGTRIDQYEMIRELGRGGMGAVYLARDTKLARRVAIKFLLTNGKQEVSQRFFQEAQATAQFNHENIVVIHDYGDYHGNPYMVLEFLQGSPLSSMIRKGQKMTVSRAVEVMISVVKALVAAHEYGIVHRDLKPDNIFLTDAGDRQGARLWHRQVDLQETDAAGEPVVQRHEPGSLATPARARTLWRHRQHRPDRHDLSTNGFSGYTVLARADSQRRHHGHPAVHVPGAVGHRARRPPHRHLGSRHPAVPDDHRSPSAPSTQGPAAGRHRHARAAHAQHPVGDAGHRARARRTSLTAA